MTRLLLLLCLSIALPLGCTNESAVPVDPDDPNPIVDPPPGPGELFTVTIENIGTPRTLAASGVFDTAVGESAPGPLRPGMTYEFSFLAAPGSALTIASMFIPSNDMFFAPDEWGIALFDDAGEPIDGNITQELRLWDTGTEINQEPGIGPDQPQRGGPLSGSEDLSNTVRIASNDTGNLPAVGDVLDVSIEHRFVDGAFEFTVTYRNVSAPTTLRTSDGMTQGVPVSPGWYAVHSAPEPLFARGRPDRGEGLEQLAEDGDPAALAEHFAPLTGHTTVMAPTVWAATSWPNVLFEEGMEDRGEGLEALSEDGSPVAIAGAIEARDGVTAHGVANTPAGASEPGPLTPGNQYRFSFRAEPGARLSFGGMYVPSNDILVATVPAGIDLFDADAFPVEGDITADVGLWNAGTEVDQPLGFGLDQVQLQAEANTGDADPDPTVRLANDDVSSTFRVTISAE